MALNLTSVSNATDWLRKNTPRGDRLDLDDYGKDYGNSIKELPKINSGNENDEFKFIAKTNELWIVEGIQVIMKITSDPIGIVGTDAKLTIQYPEIETSSAVSARTIYVDLDTYGIDGIFKLFDLLGDNKPTKLDFDTELGNDKYIIGFINLNNILLDFDQSQDTQKQILIKTENINTAPTGITNGEIYFRPVGWKILKTRW